METNNAIESLRTFALDNNEIAFVRLCDAALAGEEWAAERIENAVQQLSMAPALTPYGVKMLLKFIRATDTTRPDGSIARNFEV